MFIESVHIRQNQMAVAELFTVFHRKTKCVNTRLHYKQWKVNIEWFFRLISLSMEVQNGKKCLTLPRIIRLPGPSRKWDGWFPWKPYPNHLMFWDRINILEAEKIRWVIHSQKKKDICIKKQNVEWMNIKRETFQQICIWNVNTVTGSVGGECLLD